MPLRATDRDREAAVTVLQACYTEGRLTKDEHDARIGLALAAQTYADLDSLTLDLPQRPVYPDAPVAAGPRHTNRLAIAALVCGLAQPFTLGLSTIPAIAFGHVARGQIRRTRDDGSGMATWGLALGWAGLGLVLLVVLLAALAAVAFVRTSPTPGG